MKRFLASFFAIIYVTITAHAQWSSDPTANNPVATATTTVKSAVNAVTDGAGGMFVAWIDNSNTIYVQRMLSGGTKKFTQDVVVSNTTGTVSSTKSNLYAISDGAGGVICVWQDARNATGTSAPANNNDIYGQRIDGNGNILWTAGGVRLSVSDNTVSAKSLPIATLLNATEFAVVFGDNRQGTIDLYAQKNALSNGSALWSSDLSIHGNQSGTQTPSSADLVDDGSGGFFVTWSDPRLSTSNADIYVQRVSNGGSLLLGASGTNICNAALSQNFPRLAKDGSGGIVVTWADLRISATDINIYAQRVDANGVVQWTANGVAVCTATGSQNNPLVINAGNNFIISWADNRVSTTDRNIYAQSLSSSGTALWTTDGIAISTATGNQPSTTSSGFMISDGNNGALIYWDDTRNGASDIYAQDVNSSGVVQWTANGVPVSTATNNQSTPVAVLSAPGISLVTWRDSRVNANTTIYAARLAADGTLGGGQQQTITFSALSGKTYGDADFTPGATSTNNTIPITYTSSNPAVATIVNGAIHITGAGTTTITASQLGNATFDAATDVTQTLTVSKAMLTIKADDKTRNQGFPNPSFTFTYAGFVNGDNEQVLTTLPTATTTATLASPPGTYTIIPSGAVAANYDFTYQNGTLTVTSYIVQVITFNSISAKAYGDADFDPAATSNSSDLPITYTSSNTNVATIVNGKIHIVGAGTTVITASQAGDAGHQQATDVTQNLVVNKADLNIAADNKSKYVGQANPALTITYTGFVNGEGATILITQPVITTIATTSSPAGTYPISVSGATAANYNITYTAGTLTVSPLIPQTITFNPLPAKTYGDADFTLAGSSTNTTIPIVYTSSNPAVAVVTGNSVHIVGAGTSVITASQAGSIPYTPATDIAQTLTVNKAQLSITADNKTKLEGQANPTLTLSYTGFVNGESAANLTVQPTVQTSATNTSAIGIYPIKVAGAGSNNYTISYNNGSLTVLPAAGSSSDRLLVFENNRQSVTVRTYINTQLYGAIKAKIRIYDFSGRLIGYKESFVQQGYTDIMVPVSNFSSGNILVTVAVGTVSLNAKSQLF